jgi:hypothetical protein
MMAEADIPDLPSPEACLICLERLDQRAVALPCKHDQFDFSCIGTWLHQQRVCPLCKASVAAVKYDLGNADGGTFYSLPTLNSTPQTSIEAIRYRSRLPYRNSYSYRPESRQRAPDARRVARTRVFRGGHVRVTAKVADPAISFRREVYRAQRYSLRVGSNRISRYQNLTPSSFTSNPALVSRAKTWTRRELSAFDFLNPESPSYGQSERRASNAEFLLEYIISILKSIDLRGSQGQAEALLKDFLGHANARLFLHETEAFLRSPYERLEDWDAHVQYHESDAIDS